jgi:hypothetical protein
MSTPEQQNHCVKPKVSGLLEIRYAPWLQKCMAVTALLFLAWVHYQLAHLIVSVKINNGQCKDCNPVQALPQQALLISNIIGDNIDVQRPVFIWGPIHSGNIHFNKARLDDKLLANLRHFQSNIPTTAQPVDFNVAGDKNSKVVVKFYLRHLSTPSNKLYFSREASSENIQAEFKIRTEGLEPAIEISEMHFDDSGSMNAANVLKIGEWRYKLSGIPITVLPETGTDITFRLFSTDNTNADDTSVISATSVGVTESNEGGQTFDSLFCGAPESDKVLLTSATKLVQEGCPNTGQLRPLKLSTFAVEKEHVQISASGNAWVLNKGELITKNINALIKENPYLAALLAIFDAFVVAWLKRVFGQK